MTVRRPLRQILFDRRGAMVIETAIVAPVLVLLALGGFEISQIVSRQHELQSGVAEAEAIALAANAGASVDADGLKSALMESLSLPSDDVTVERLYRCGTDEALVDTPTNCGEGEVVSNYVRVGLTDVYHPIWNRLGVKADFNFDVVRTIQLL